MVEIGMQASSRDRASSSSHTSPADRLMVNYGDSPDDELTVEITSELDLSTVPSLRSALEVAMTAAVRRVVVDLSAVEFMDCSSLRPLRAAAGSLRLQGRYLLLRRPSAPVCRLLDVTGVAGELPLEPPPLGASVDLSRVTGASVSAPR